MRTAINIFFGSFFLFLLLFSILGCNAMAFQTKTAWNQFDEIVDKIENSHFDSNMITELIRESKERGYEVVIAKDQIYEDREQYQVSLTYAIKIPVLEFSKERVISGYAI
jgi:hypothetical protein